MFQRIFTLIMVCGGVFATLTIMPTGTAATLNPSTTLQQEAGSNGETFADITAYRDYRCRIVTAVDLNYYATSTSSTPIGKLYRNQTFATTGIADGRYHVYNPYNDTWGGWTSADPQWTNYAGERCFG